MSNLLLQKTRAWLGSTFALFVLFGASFTGAAVAQSSPCEYRVENDWGSGAVVEIEVTNTTDTAIDGWSVSWHYEHTTIDNHWNAQLSGDNPYTAADVGWNATLQPGQSAVFGLQVSYSAGTEAPKLTGSLCEENDHTDPGDGGDDNGGNGDGGNGDGRLPDDLSSVELTQKMGIGWNLGNSLEAIGGETAWGNPPTNRELIDAVREAGFDNIRIPVAWSVFSDAQNYIIDSDWMDRVEEVVNYALDADFYVTVNIHWDGGWQQPTYADQEYVNNRLAIMWTQIAEHFKDYDHRLLFAGTNEVMVEGDYGTPTEEYYTVQNSFNQTFVDTVRATGGNNADRFLIVQGFNTNIDHTINFAQIPHDPADERLMMEVHYYDPYNFTLNEESNISQWGSIATDPELTETWANESYVNYQFGRMKTHFVDQGIGVILGEYGVISRVNVADHETYRRYWNEYITASALEHGLVPVYWDNGWAGNFGFALFDRHNGAQIEPELIQAILGTAD